MNGNGKEYALALYAIALENGNGGMQVMYDDLCLVRDAIRGNPEYMEFLINPSISKSERLGSLSSAFEDTLSEDVFSFLGILCEHGSMYVLPAAIDEFSSMYEDYMRFANATITSAVELTEDEKSKLITKLQKVTNKRIKPEYVIDKSIMGGLTVMVDGKFYDGSVRKNLNNIKEVMS